MKLELSFLDDGSNWELATELPDAVAAGRNLVVGRRMVGGDAPAGRATIGTQP